MRLPSLARLALLSPLFVACGPQPYLLFWEWEDAACDQAPCWGRVKLLGSEVTYEQDGVEPNQGLLTEQGLAALEDSLAGLCRAGDEPATSDRVASLLLDCEVEQTWVHYDKTAPSSRFEGVDLLMNDVVWSLQACRHAESTVPDHHCVRME